MRKSNWLLSLGTMVCLASSAFAQPGSGRGWPTTSRPGPDDQRSVLSALDKLDARLKELERQIDRQKQPVERKADAPRTGPGGPPPFAFGGAFRMGPGGPPPIARAQLSRGGFGGPPPFAGSQRPRFGPGATSRTSLNPAPKSESQKSPAFTPWVPSSSVERQIDRIIAELEQLKKEVRSQRR